MKGESTIFDNGRIRDLAQFHFNRFLWFHDIRFRAPFPTRFEAVSNLQQRENSNRFSVDDYVIHDIARDVENS